MYRFYQKERISLVCVLWLMTPSLIIGYSKFMRELWSKAQIWQEKNQHHQTYLTFNWHLLLTYWLQSLLADLDISVSFIYPKFKSRGLYMCVVENFQNLYTYKYA